MKPLSYRTLLVNLLITAICLTAAAYGRVYFDSDRINTGLSEGSFFRRKIVTTTTPKVLLAGTSRAYRGLVPEEISNVLGIEASEVLNFGFSSCAYNDMYLQRLDELLSGPQPQTVLLEIIPGAFKPTNLKKNGFIRLEWKYGPLRNEPLQLLKQRLVEPLMSLAESDCFRPINSRLVERIAEYGLNPPVRYTYFQHFDSTGWVISRLQPPVPDFYFENLEKSFINNQVSVEAIQHFLKQVAAWRDRGVMVYGARLPVNDGVRKREDSYTGINWDWFIAEFTGHGGRWINLPHSSYPTYDGSHMPEESARKYSRDLAKWISADLKKQGR